MKKHTLQESFWKGSFGNEYIARNSNDNLITANLHLFGRILSSIKAGSLNSIIEFGTNIGLNLIALHSLIPTAKLYGIEINKQAFEHVKKLEYVQAYNKSIYDFKPKKVYDLAFTKGVLIHQAPNMLPKVYEALYKASAKYILIAEYYNPTPVEVPYHGHSSVLFKRDFAGEILDKYPDLSLRDYGFAYHRDILCPQGDVTWFLLEKKVL